jgi:hypothetical protein
MVNAVHNSIYEYAACYESYIQARIENDNALVEHIHQYIPVAESVASDKRKNRAKDAWDSFVAFVEKMMGKFTEAISNKFLFNKSYLEKYKDIILNKKPKHIAFSFNGDYNVAIKRCMNSQIPVFDYETHAAMLSDTDKSDSEIVKAILPNGNDFTYDQNASLSDQLKTYFLGAENNKKTEGYFDTTNALNWTDMYNYCYNAKKITEVSNKDKQYLTQSTNAIMRACNDQIRNAGTNTTTKSTNAAEPAENGGGKDTTVTGDADKKESVIYSGKHMYFFETDGDNKTQDSSATGSADSSKTATSSNLTIDTDAASKTSSYANRDKVTDETKQKNADAATAAGETTKNMDTLTARWIKICKAIISAKLTVLQKLNSDFMTMIRAHVRSYVGDDEKKVETSKEAEPPTNYGKKK